MCEINTEIISVFSSAKLRESMCKLVFNVANTLNNWLVS